MADPVIGISDAAKAVIDRTITRLEDVLTLEQVAVLKQLVTDGKIFDVDSLLTLAEPTNQRIEATDGN